MTNLSLLSTTVFASHSAKGGRRGTNGVYQQPRDILAAIPGLQVVETPRTRENTWCCGAGRGVLEAFPDFALWGAQQKMEELREVGAEAVIGACPYCKGNLTAGAKAGGDKIKVYDIAELIASAI